MTNPFFDDAIGEIGNIMMGAGATNLAGLLGTQVSITTPTIDLDIPRDWPSGKAVVVSIEMSGAVVGRSLFVLPTHEVEAIVRLMMTGMDFSEDELLGELGLSAIGEAMNQLIAGAARALGEILGGLVDITPPTLELVDADWQPNFAPPATCTVTFSVHIGTETTGSLSWVMDRDLATDLIARIEAGMSGAPAHQVPAAVAPTPAPAQVHAATATAVMAPPAPAPAPTPVSAVPPPQVSAATYPELGPSAPPVTQAELAMISEVALTVTVELGRTRITVRDLLGLGQGSVVELDRAAGSPVDILVNGTLVARGDVVVVDDELGVRVSEVIDPRERA